MSNLVQRIDRPDPKQLKLYFLTALAGSVGSLGFGLPFILLGMIPLVIKYKTMRYRIDDEGVGVQWGWLFRSESYLTYEKIQDIHLNRGFFERWLGLGRVSIQTASGSSGAEVALIGLTEFDAVRDYLYSRMRTGAAPARLGEESIEDGADAIALLTSIRDEVTALATRLDAGESSGPASEGAPDA